MTARAAPRAEPTVPDKPGPVPDSESFPVIDEGSSAWKTYVRTKIAEALADPRPSVPAEEAFARMDADFAAFRSKRGL